MGSSEESKREERERGELEDGRVGGEEREPTSFSVDCNLRGAGSFPAPATRAESPRMDFLSLRVSVGGATVAIVEEGGAGEKVERTRKEERRRS